MHAHLTTPVTIERLLACDIPVELADIVVGYQTYPHEDMDRTARVAGQILLDKLAKTVTAGRQRLAIGSPTDDPTGGHEDPDPSKGFFDQDS